MAADWPWSVPPWSRSSTMATATAATWISSWRRLTGIPPGGEPSPPGTGRPRWRSSPYPGTGSSWRTASGSPGRHGAAGRSAPGPRCLLHETSRIPSCGSAFLPVDLENPTGRLVPVVLMGDRRVDVLVAPGLQELQPEVVGPVLTFEGGHLGVEGRAERPDHVVGGRFPTMHRRALSEGPVPLVDARL